MTEPLETSSSDETTVLGHALATALRPGDVVALTGDLGAGKTQLVKGVAEGLGVREAVTSPTFSILGVHPGTRLTLNHFDLYRLDLESELEDIDFWGVMESGGATLVEWGDRFPEALPSDHLSVVVTFVSDTARRFGLVPAGPRSAALAREWATAARERGLGVGGGP